MKVKMITALTSKDLNLSFGEVVLVNDTFGKQLIKSNMAVLVEEEIKQPITQEPIDETPVKRGRKKKVVK